MSLEALLIEQSPYTSRKRARRQRERGFDDLDRAVQVFVGVAVVDVPVVVGLDEKAGADALGVKAGAAIFVMRIGAVEREKGHHGNARYRDRLLRRGDDLLEPLEKTRAALPE